MSRQPTDAVTDDDSDTEPLKTGSKNVVRPNQLTTKEIDLNGTAETDITDGNNSILFIIFII